MLLIASGCAVSWGFVLGNGAMGDLPWNTLYVQFTTDLLQTNDEVHNLHEKSLQRDRGSAVRSHMITTYGSWVGLERPFWLKSIFQGEHERQLTLHVW